MGTLGIVLLCLGFIIFASGAGYFALTIPPAPHPPVPARLAEPIITVEVISNSAPATSSGEVTKRTPTDIYQERVEDIRDRAASTNPISLVIKTFIYLFKARRVKEITQVETEGYLTYLDNAIAARNKEKELARIDLEDKAARSGLSKTIAVNHHDEVDAKVKTRNLLHPKPEPKPPKKPRRVDPLKEMEKRWREELDRGALGVHSVYDRLRREYEILYKDDPDQLEAILTKLERLKEKEAGK